ncbi:MAG: zinc ribbon domain-containing protein [Terriglobia bacterium]
MPIFEYACPQCGHVFEKLVLTRHQEPPECPQCGWKKVDQKFSTFATTGPANRLAAGTCAPSGGG